MCIEYNNFDLVFILKFSKNNTKLEPGGGGAWDWVSLNLK